MATDPMLDPDYKYSINKFTGNGSKTSWDLNFSGGYIRREHVKAYTQAADGQITELSFTWSGPNTIVITPPVANGVRLFVYRDTPKSGPLVDFTDGATINEFDLDMMARQTVFATAEMVDRFADVAIDSQEATATATEALQRAAAAQVDVAAATTASVAALGTAQAAETKANAAVSTANTAKGTADAAAAAAGGAVVTANAADSKATSALSQAATAAGQSASALTTSQSANSKADTAVARALDAQSAAANANTVASAAQGVANTTAEQFDALRDTVEEIAGGDLSNLVRVTQENDFTAKQTFSAGAVIGGVQWGGSGANAKIINAWGDLTDTPETFPPSPHGHTIADVANLQTTLDAKASSSLLALKADLAGAVFTGPLVRGTWASGGFSRLNPEALLIRSPSQIDIELSHGQGGENPAFIRYTTGNVLTINAPNPIQSNGKTILTGAAVDDAVLKSTTNLGRTGNGPLAAVSNADLAAAPTGWAMMTAPGSSTPGGSYGFFFKTGRSDNSNGWSGIWQGHSGTPNRMYLGWTGAATDAPIWNEVATCGAPGAPLNQNFYGVRAFVNDGGPAAEFWNGAGDGVRFGPKGGISFAEGGAWLTSDPYFNFKNFTLRNRDESFRDITASRGDGSGAIFLGGGSYLYHNTVGQYEFGGAKQVRMNENLVLTNGAGGRIYIGNGKQPRISVQATAPTAELQEGDLWVW